MFSDPEKNLKALGLKENDVVVDLGAGTGYYSVAAGKLVPQGKVYAIEIVKDFLHTIEKKVKEARLHNVEIIWGDIEKIGGTKIGDSVADIAVASNVLSQVENKVEFIKEIKRVLKIGGKVLVIDWTESSIMGAKALVSQNKALDMFKEAGFALMRQIDAGAHHYGMILTKS